MDNLHLDRSTTGGIPPATTIDTADGSTLFASNVMSPYTVSTPLAYNTTYYWTVVATNSAGDSDPATACSFTTRSNPTISTSLVSGFWHSERRFTLWQTGVK